MDSFNPPPQLNEESEEQTKKQEEISAENAPDAKQEKIKTLVETADFWINYARDNVSYFGRVYDIEQMEQKVRMLGGEAGALAEKYNWIKNSINLYSSMIPVFEESKKYLEEGRLEFPWGKSIEGEMQRFIEARRSL